MIKKSVLYFCVIAFLANLIIYLSLKFKPSQFTGENNEYLMWQFQKQMIHQPDKFIKNAIIGDSRALAGIDPLQLARSYYNFSVGGGSFFEGYVTLRDLLKVKKIDTLILCYAPFNFENSLVLNERTIPFGFVNESDLVGLYELEAGLKSSVTGDYLTGSIHRMAGLMKYHHFPMFYRGTFVHNLLFNGDAQTGKKIISEMARSQGHIFFGQRDSCDNLSEEVNSAVDGFYFNPVLRSYFDSICDLATKNRIQCYVFCPPINKATYDALPAEYLQSFEQNLETVKKSQPGINIYTKVPVFPNTMYGDGSHLNRKGAFLFSENIRKTISSGL